MGWQEKFTVFFIFKDDLAFYLNYKLIFASACEVQ